MPSFDKLIKILHLEEMMEYQNKAVIGGLEKYAPFWREEVAGECLSDEKGVLIDRIVHDLDSYPSCETTEQRRAIIAGLLDLLQQPISKDVSRTREAEDAVAQIGAGQVPPLVKPCSTPAPEADNSLPVPSTRAPEPSKPAPQPAYADSAQPSPKSVQRGQGLEALVTTLPSVGETQATRLKKLGVVTIQDLIHLFPRRYDDYSHLKSIGQLVPGEDVTIIANVRNVTLRQLGPNRCLVKCTISDGTGTMQVTWFNQPYLERRLQAGRQIVLSGKVDQYLGLPTMTSPEWEPLEKEQINTGRLVPVYPLTEGVSSRWLRRLIKRAVDFWAERVPEHLPEGIRQRRKLLTLAAALREIHFPSSWGSLQQARRRLAFDELLMLQLRVLILKHAWRSQDGIPIPIDQPVVEQYIASLPYALTEAQKQALNDILSDLSQRTPMNRLLQGDVGSGKTVVAATAALATVRAGYQVAIMAPTEILADQHFKSLTGFLSSATVAQENGERPVSIRLLTGSTKTSERRATYDEISQGHADVVIGTHALIQEEVRFHRLALVIVDEQHRFGVAQRAALRNKGLNPHLLVMTATPIPRTLSLTLFGDLDLSIIDQMPPGRQPIRTYIVTGRERERAYQFVRQQVKQGHQSFIIFPLVEESESIDAKAAVEEHRRLQNEIFPQLRLGLLHGRMKSDEKEHVMRGFVAGELDILVSTAVVEVGIDVPNATVMLIEGANRFGLAQLHQFRGRVGRGTAPSYCLLVSDNSSEEGLARLEALVETQDGFVLAEKDLEMRGPGEFFGTRQSGLPDLRMAGFADLRLLETARSEAQTILSEDPLLKWSEHSLLSARVEALRSGQTDPS